MVIWKQCTMTTLYHSADPSEEYPCVVKINDDEILVEYEDGGYVQYIGKSNGDGHFKLEGSGFDGRATLHSFSEGAVLEGSWIEEGVRGMWRIKLA